MPVFSTQPYVTPRLHAPLVSYIICCYPIVPIANVSRTQTAMTPKRTHHLFHIKHRRRHQPRLLQRLPKINRPFKRLPRERH